MNKYERIFRVAKAKRGHANWLDAAVAPFIVDLEDATGEEVEAGGPYGLRAEVRISIGSAANRRYLTVTPAFDDDGNLQLYFDTGEKRAKHGAGTLGDLHGFNNIDAPLPDSISEILSKFKRG